MINLNAVKELYNHYHTKVIVNPTLYVPGENGINLVLPEELLEYANAAAGHSNYRPIGIRKYCSNPKEEIAKIFSSVESLIEFIESSECNAIEHIKILKANKNKKIKKEQSAREMFWKKYDKSIMESLKSKYDINTLRTAFDSLSITEFEQKFGL